MSRDFSADRENARRSNGQFGHQALPEADIELHPTDQERLPAQHQLLATAVQEHYPGATTVEVQYGAHDGSVYFSTARDRAGRHVTAREGVNPMKRVNAMDKVVHGYPVADARAADPEGRWIAALPDDLGMHRAFIDVTAAPTAMPEEDKDGWRRPADQLREVIESRPKLAAECERLRHAGTAPEELDARGMLAFQAAVYSAKRAEESVAGRAVRQQIAAALDAEGMLQPGITGEVEFVTEGDGVTRLTARNRGGYVGQARAKAVRTASGETRDDEMELLRTLNGPGGVDSTLGFLDRQMRGLTDEQLAVSGITRTDTGFTVRLDGLR